MRFSLALLAGVCAVFAAVAAAMSADEIIASVNGNPKSTWKAAHNQFSSWTVEQKKSLLGVDVKSLKGPMIYDESAVSAGTYGGLPDAFDARTQWPNCIHPVRDQQKCGSCWAFSASEVASDRLCIASKGQTNVVLSPQWIVSCDSMDMGCNGGQLNTVWTFLTNRGTVPDTCDPYTSGSGNVPSCPAKCADGSAPTVYKSKSFSQISGGLLFWETVSKMKQQIMTEGPIQVAFSVYEDFIHYSSGVYTHTSGQLLGGHAVEAVGWGKTSDGVAYWIIKNSWNVQWGIEGFFWIKLGVDECGIESNAYAGHF